MEKKPNYICSLCGRTHYDLDDYLKDVTRCGAELKAREEEEKNKKRLAEINAAINGVKQAKAYYEEQLAKFKEKYPEEYKLNFVYGDTEKCGCESESTLAKKSTKPKITTISYEDNGKDEPTLKVNGKEAEDASLKTLFNDPEIQHLAKLLGMI